MNSAVTALSETSVMSISCFVMSESNRSNGPSKLLRLTEKPDDSTGSAGSRGSTLGCPNSAATLRDGATGDQLSGQLAIGVRCGR